MCYIYYLCIASVSIFPLQRVTSRNDIECPGDIISYNCSIQSNSETVHLIWRVTLPGRIPINITYDSTSTLNDVDNLKSFISTSLDSLISDEYIESTLWVIVQVDIPANQTELECITGDLGIDSVSIFVNASGMCIAIYYD